MKKQLLYKNFSWNLLGSLIYAFTQYLLVVIVGRIGGAEVLGLYSLGLALTAPLIMFTNLKLRTVLSTGYHNEFNFIDFGQTRLLGNITFLIFTVLAIVILDYENHVVIVILLIAISKVIESFSDLLYGNLQFYERLDIVAKSFIMRGLIGLLLFTTIFLLTENLTYSLMGLSVAWLVILIFFDLRKNLDFISLNFRDFNRKNMLRIIVISLPLGIISLLASLNVNIPRIIIEKNLSLQELGYFTSVFYLTIILGKFVTSLGAAVLPRLSKFYESKNYKAHLKLTLKFMILILVISLTILSISYFFGETILFLLYGVEYSHLGTFFVLVMLYGLLNYLVYGIKVSLESTRTFKPQLYIEVTNLILTLILSLVFIPQHGIFGAVYALLIAASISVIILAILYTKLFIIWKGDGLK